jgi:hypothetical protein
MNRTLSLLESEKRFRGETFLMNLYCGTWMGHTKPGEPFWTGVRGSVEQSWNNFGSFDAFSRFKPISGRLLADGEGASNRGSELWNGRLGQIIMENAQMMAAARSFGRVLSFWYLVSKQWARL